MTWPLVGIATVVATVKTRLPVVVAPDTLSAVVAIVLGCTTNLLPPRAIGATLVPAPSTVKALAAEVVEAVTANPT